MSATSEVRMTTHTFPFPTALAELVETVVYKPAWRAHLREVTHDGACSGLLLLIMSNTQDSYHPEDELGVQHSFPVPAATYDKQSWRRWLFNRFLDVETHEACEFFQVDGERPYAPNHGPGRDPFLVFEYATDTDRRTSFRGDVKDVAS